MDDPVLEEAAPLNAKPRIAVNPTVFFISAALILAFALFGALAPDRAGRVFDFLQAGIVADFGWFYITAVAGFLIFALFLMISRYGDVKLGPDDSEPEYSYLSWFAMLFSAGMGIGLIFFGVAEPIQHYAIPPVGDGKTVEAARQAMVLTFFHWGLHAWAIYVVVGLALAYFAFRRGLPLTVRSALHPLIGDRIYGPIGHAVDIFAVLGTMFGVATSLGLGVLQVNSGFAYLFGLPVGAGVQIALIAAITGMATLSVVMGLDRGVKRLSELNIVLAGLLLVFVLLAGSTVFLLQAFVQNIGTYLGEVIPRTFRMYAYEPNPWLGDWTLFYWGWWIAWSPFVGMFIARISRGRTIRQFVGGVLLVPVLFTFLWMTVFGNTAIELDMTGVAPVADAVANNLPTALFEVLGQLPFSAIASGIATLLVITFFITSADSGALVMDLIASGGAENPPVWQRVFWAVCSGGIAAVLLMAGGLQALQTAAITSALPFAFVMIFICYGLLRALQMEGRSTATGAGAVAMPPAGGGGPSWQQRLGSIVEHHGKDELLAYLDGVAAPAMSAVAEQVEEGGLSSAISRKDESLTLSIDHGERGTFAYTVRVRGFRTPSFAWIEPGKEKDREERHYRVLGRSSEDAQGHDITGFTADQIIHDFLARYAHFRQATQSMPN
ncbi:BCCT family transporter [Tsuneonella amylolytica]|uniref:BCCT family transporter n=1 Tax=Tsuneonella amylolytica TaxID=2338327 RepID=UPI000EAA7353|nr:BCCT family transporter [Tsuneonella amylolytica]